MLLTSTHSNLILYVYNELDEKDAKEMEELLKIDAQMNEEFKQLKKTISLLEITTKKPRKDVLNGIKAYCKTSNHYPSKHCESIEIIHN